jgi:hypothetical protein
MPEIKLASLPVFSGIILKERLNWQEKIPEEGR